MFQIHVTLRFLFEVPFFSPVGTPGNSPGRKRRKPGELGRSQFPSPERGDTKDNAAFCAAPSGLGRPRLYDSPGLRPGLSMCLPRRSPAERDEDGSPFPFQGKGRGWVIVAPDLGYYPFGFIITSTTSSTIAIMPSSPPNLS